MDDLDRLVAKIKARYPTRMLPSGTPPSEVYEMARNGWLQVAVEIAVNELREELPDPPTGEGVD